MSGSQPDETTSMRSSFGLFRRSAIRRYERIGWIIVGLICVTFPVFGQAAACPSTSVPAAAEADKAYSQKRYADAENLYVKALAQQPKNIELTAGLVRTLLQEGKISQASAQVDSPENARSAIALTALAEVQLRQGLPWLTMKSLDAAQAANPCYARSHLVRSRALRIDSMYASERAEIQRAYEIDPTDPDIQGAWRDIVSPASEIKSIDQSLATMNDLDAKARQTAETSAHTLMLQLSENSQNCQVLPTVASAKLPLVASIENKLRHLYRYQLEVQLPQSKANLLVDTAASGLYISRALAEQNNLHQGAGAPEGTVHVDDVNIGPLEFRDCTVGVSDTPFPDKADGIIGTDIFASYLITLDFRSKRLTLDPLPAEPGLLPGDRVVPPELKDFTPVYHRRQYLLLPVTLNKKSCRLFVLGSGMPYTAITSEVAHSVSNSRADFTNSARAASGAKEEFYSDKFDLQLANLPLIQHRRIAEFDLSAMDQNAGFQVAGGLGLDILHPMVLHLDYRDGLVKFDLADEELMPVQRNGTSISVM
jgi:tetratricopeptide (TPR) repeat protein